MNDLKRWNIELENMPGFMKSMERIEAWFEGEVVDRAPIRFSQQRLSMIEEKEYSKTWPSLKARWMDTEFIVNDYVDRLENKPLLAETFPVFTPNLGPNWYAGCFGAPIEFGEVTSWALEIIDDYDEWLPKLKFDWDCELFKKMEELTEYALSVCKGKFIVGYTDLHPGMDCAAALRGTENMLYDLVDQPENVEKLVKLCEAPFFGVYDYFDAKLKAQGMPSVTWLEVPSFGTLHIPSADFSAMISAGHFNSLVFPSLEEECKHFTQNIFHLDGKGVANHTDSILALPNVQAIQWVPGAGNGEPIMQWVPYLKRLLSAGKSVIIDLKPSELESFIGAFDKPDGIMLCIPSFDTEEQKEIIKRVERW